MAVHINNIQAIIMFGISRLNTVIESVGYRCFGAGAARPYRIQPSGGICRSNRIIGAAGISNGHRVGRPGDKGSLEWSITIHISRLRTIKLDSAKNAAAIKSVGQQPGDAWIEVSRLTRVS